MSPHAELEGQLSKIDALLDMGKLAIAERELSATMKLAPESPSVHYRALQLRVAQLRYSDAVDMANKILARDPENINAKYYLAICLEFTGKVPQAIDLWKILLQKQPENATFHACFADAMFWNPELGVPMDEIELQLRNALKLDPTHRTAKHLEFWIAQRQGDGARMQSVVADVQRAYPGERIAAKLLSRFIREYKKEDSEVIPDLLRIFPDDPDLLQMAKEVHTIKKWGDMFASQIFELFPAEAPPWLVEKGRAKDYPNNPKWNLEFAVDGAPSFGLRKLAKDLLNVPDHDRSAIVMLLMDLSARDTGKKLRILPLLLENLNHVAEKEYDLLIQKAFVLNYVELFETLFSRHGAGPSEETWEFIWHRILDRQNLLDKILERYATFNPRPPVAIDLLINSRSGKLRKPMITVVKHLLNLEPETIGALWRIFLDQMGTLPNDQREDVFSIIANAKLNHLVSRPGFSMELLNFLSESKNLKMRSFETFWYNLGYLPEAILEKLVQDADYPRLLRRLFDQVVIEKAGGPEQSLALFLSRAPWNPEVAAEFQDEVIKQSKETMDQKLRELLANVVRRYNIPSLADERAELQKRERDLAARERQNLHLKNTADVAMAQANVAALQAKFVAKMTEIQNSSMSPAQKAEEMQAAANELRHQIEELTKSMGGEKTGTSD